MVQRLAESEGLAELELLGCAGDAAKFAVALAALERGSADGQSVLA